MALKGKLIDAVENKKHQDSNAQGQMAEVYNQKMLSPQQSVIAQAVQDKGRILGISGSMDYVNKVIPSCYAAHKEVIEPSTSVLKNLSSYDLVVVGCPGLLADNWTAALRNYVKEGGYLVTTDWCISNCLQEAFPGYIQNGGGASGNYAIRIVQPDHPFLVGAQVRGIVEWEVEGGSHLIKIKNRKEVKVLIDSPDMQKDYKHGAIMVTFPYGKGHIVHFISHVYLQASDNEGNYVAAYILSNILDEAVRERHGISTVGAKGALSKLRGLLDAPR